jgi:hypothetical protein
MTSQDEPSDKPSETYLLENFFNKRDRELIEEAEKRVKPAAMKKIKSKITQLKIKPQTKRSRKSSIETILKEESSLGLYNCSQKNYTNSSSVNILEKSRKSVN